ncbi:hypothetical protein H311_03768 [Anncaliia algerae PRA109]|nr:hypothetical protein H311_03768 [Anncaliia algerae PRA109]
MKYLLELIIITFLVVYFVMLVYSAIDLKRYSSKLASGKVIFKEKIINEYVSKNYYEFVTNESKKTEEMLEYIYVSILSLGLIVSFNLLIYFRKTNDYFVDVVKILIKFAQYFHFFGRNNDIAALTFLSLIILCLVPILFPLKLNIYIYIPCLVSYYLALIIFRKKLIPKRSGKYKRDKLIIYGLLSFIPLYIFHSLISFSLTLNGERRIPDFFGERCKNLAYKHFGKENIYFINTKQVNMSTMLRFYTKIFLIFGDWSIFSQPEILGCVSHEIGHGGAIESFFMLLLEHFTKVMSLFIYCEVINSYSKKIDSRFKKNVMRYFLFYFNLYILSLIYKIPLNFLSQNVELLADKRSRKIALDANIIELWFKVITYKKDMFYKPKYYTLLFSTHPSFYHRIKNLVNK